MKIIQSALLLAFAALISLPLTGCGSSSTQTIPLTETIFYAHTFLPGNNGTLLASGYNAYGQLGDGSLNGSSSFHQVTTATGMTTVSGYSAGANHSLAFRNYTVWSWGCNFNGRLGVGDNPPTTGISAFSPTPHSLVINQTILDQTPVTGVAAGWVHSLALAAPTGTSQGSVWAWGDNSYGELGINNLAIASSSTPVRVQVMDPNTNTAVNFTGVKKVVAGGGHSLALKTDGTVWGWGYGRYGQTGKADGSNVAIPTQIAFPSGTTVTDIAAAGSYSLAVVDDANAGVTGEVYAWGFNGYGQLGNSHTSTTANATPTLVVDAAGNPLTGVTKISAGTMFVLALTDHGVYAWGYNLKGQLGTGTNELNITYAVPAKTINAIADTKGFPGVTDILAVGDSSLAKVAGTWYGWGDYGWGQLGLPVPNNAVAYLLEPMAIPMPQ
ncbi:hypothetical protein L4X63_14610 [Geomonas sp. Red32]|uniref:RCC1 domain-containing protein n=1 Tax=Geomonas sp. Red32 TaxID=2912856 RepID=UPI00202CE954|nr:hypothetical protein [Geomonas sp. Red32]MCM0082824.1 hypothetical protein [Geomonas sp. Red32]